MAQPWSTKLTSGRQLANSRTIIVRQFCQLNTLLVEQHVRLCIQHLA